MNRSSAWRRANDAVKDRKNSRAELIRNERRRAGHGRFPTDVEKTWKMMAGRSKKVARARQLGFDYPRKTQRQVVDEQADLDQ